MLGVAQLINEASAYESSNDHDVALRLYKTAFNNLLDINGQVNAATLNNITGVSPFEIREAITQFKKYIDIFKQHTKAPEYAFEHAAWLSQQYLMFADIFHQAVNGGVKASKAQHPGYYYCEAAMQMIERRQNITEYTNDNIRSNQMPVTNELLSMITTSNFASFLRQCGWICVDPNAGPPVAPISLPKPKSLDSEIEPINYSEIIIRALYKAIEYFEEWSRPRMQHYISVLIADEYMLSNNFQKALMLYSRSLANYEKDGWSPLVDSLKGKLAIVEQSIGNSE